MEPYNLSLFRTNFLYWVTSRVRPKCWSTLTVFIGCAGLTCIFRTFVCEIEGKIDLYTVNHKKT